MSSTREQVIDELVTVHDAAEASGGNGWSALKAMGVPDAVAGEVIAESSSREVEGWWQAIERTIDGELVRRSIASVNDGDPPA